MINIPKMKLPKRYTEIIKRLKNSTPEEKVEVEDDFIKAVNDRESKFYTPMMASMNEQELRTMIRTATNLIDIEEDKND